MISLPNSLDIKELLNNLRDISWNVSDVFKSYNIKFFSKEELITKLDVKKLEKGLVTAADLEVSELIKNKIKEKYPNVGWEFLSEEDDNQKHRNFKDKWVWIIDPLDGTKDFVNGTGEYAMHLALYFKNQIIIGIVLVPDKENLWIYFKGIGTWCEDRKNKKEMSFKQSLKNFCDITILTSRSHSHPKLQLLLERLKPKKIIGMGSIGYKVASILQGKGDLYISYSLPNGSCPKDWDIAAPAAIIEGAGGYFTDIKGSKIEFLNRKGYEQGGILVSSINQNHQHLCEEISERINIL